MPYSWLGILKNYNLFLSSHKFIPVYKKVVDNYILNKLVKLRYDTLAFFIKEDVLGHDFVEGVFWN